MKEEKFLDTIRRKMAERPKICATCGHLVRLGGTMIGCDACDKLILPDYPPYDGNMTCPDWKI